MGRVIAAGLLAGLVLNLGEAVLHGVIFAAPAAQAMKQLGHDIAGSGASTVLGGDLGCLMHIAGRLVRTRAKVEARHVAEVLAGMTDEPAIAAPKQKR